VPDETSLGLIGWRRSPDCVVIVALIGAFVPMLLGKETVGQLEKITEAIPELA
jgi:hypothetical protein